LAPGFHQLSLSGENGFFLLPIDRVAGMVKMWCWGAITMKKTALLTYILVRAYVAQVGLAQAKAMAHAAGLTGSEEREAAQCLEKKI
jgi:hypothetical protein